MAILLMPAFSSYAQSYNDAIEKFNEALEVAQNRDFPNAIILFKETITISEAVGSEADDIKTRAEGQIPRLALQIAALELRERNFGEGIEALKDAEELALKYGDEQNAQRARSNLPRAYLQYGNTFYREGESARAEEQYRAALEIAPTYATAYYQLGLVYRQKEELEEALGYFDRAIELADQQNDADNAQRSRNAARDYLVFTGANLTENSEYASAEATIRRALRYDNDSAEAHYRLAEVLNAQEKWSEALASANRALQLKSDSPASDKARIHFEAGVAQKNLGNKSAACSSFRNAAHGDFRDAAEHEIEYELEC